jgi:hypothetical protein
MIPITSPQFSHRAYQTHDSRNPADFTDLPGGFTDEMPLEYYQPDNGLPGSGYWLEPID